MPKAHWRSLTYVSPDDLAATPPCGCAEATRTDCSTTRIRGTFLVAILASRALDAGLAFARDASLEKSAIEMTIHEDVANFNRGDPKTVVAACAPHTSVVDGFHRTHGRRVATGGEATSRATGLLERRWVFWRSAT